MRPITLYTLPNVVGKQPQRFGDTWVAKRFSSAAELLQWTYIEGHPITGGPFDSGVKDNEHWQQTDIVILDFDNLIANTTAQDVLASCAIPEHVLLIRPSSSYHPLAPKFHAFVQIDRRVATEVAHKNLHSWTRGQFSIESDNAFERTPSQGLAGTRFTRIPQQPALNDGLYYINTESTPLHVTTTLNEVMAAQGGYGIVNTAEFDRRADADNNTPLVSRRAETHYEQPTDVRVRVALDAFQWAAKGWGRRDYSEWLALVFSLYDGTDGAPQAMHAVLDHPDIEWAKPSDRDAFVRFWRKHTPRTDGRKVTVATLFRYARANGWLQQSSIDIPDAECELFHSTEVADWVLAQEPDNLRRALIMSNTGTGKTLGAIAHLKHMKPTKALFIAPTIRLCMALSQTLTDNGVDNVLYRDDDNNIHDGDTLKDAKVLVTTLQTFSSRVYQRGMTLTDYKFVALDESDELLSAFVRAGSQQLGGFSHVSTKQGVQGMYTIAALLRDAHTVLMLDGTATKVSKTVLERFSPPSLVKVYRNTWQRPKAPVQMIETHEEAMQHIMDSIAAHKHTVVVCDTQQGAQRIQHYIEVELGAGISTKVASTVEGLLRVCGDTKTQAVNGFFADVNEGAKQYPILIYNSAMGSGVSITSVEPEVVVQIASYLSPPKNLQLLNRYRKQAQVYVHYRNGERLYSDTAQNKFKRQAGEVQRVAVSIGLPFAQRDEVAAVSEEVFQLAMQHEYDTMRAPRDYYEALLRKDGRGVRPLDAPLGNDTYKRTMKQVSDAMKLLKAEAALMWRLVEPLSVNAVPDENMSPVEVAAAELHATIAYRLGSEGLDRAKDTAPDTVAKYVHGFGKYSRVWQMWLNPTMALRESILNTLQEGRAINRAKLYLSKARMLAALRYLIKDGTEFVDDVLLAERAPQFVHEIAAREVYYNAVVNNYKQDFAHVMAKHNDVNKQAIALARNLMRNFGLKLNKQKTDGSTRAYTVTNLVQWQTFMGWVLGDKFTSAALSFDNQHLIDAEQHMLSYRAKFEALPATMQADVLRRLQNSDSTPFELIVDMVTLHNQNALRKQVGAPPLPVPEVDATEHDTELSDMLNYF